MNIYTTFGSPTFNSVRSIAEKRNVENTWQHCFLVIFTFDPPKTFPASTYIAMPTLVKIDLAILQCIANKQTYVQSIIDSV
jgi:hypothetical protein